MIIDIHKKRDERQQHADGMHVGIFVLFAVDHKSSIESNGGGGMGWYGTEWFIIHIRKRIAEKQQQQHRHHHHNNKTIIIKT